MAYDRKHMRTTSPSGRQTHRMSHKPLYRAVYARLLCSALSARGVDTGSLLAEVGLTDAALAEAHAWLDFDQFTRLCEAARSRCPDPLLAFDWGRRITDNAHGLSGIAVTSAPDVITALQTLRRVSVLRSTTVQAELAIDKEVARLSYREILPLGKLREFLHVPLTMLLVRLLEAVLGDAVSEMHIELPFPSPTWAAECEDHFPCPVHFDATCLCILLPTHLLGRRTPMADMAAHQGALRQCELDRLGLDQGMLPRITAYLASHAERAPSAAEVADVFCLSARTLRRTLEREGTNFRRLLVAARMDAAGRYLGATTLPVEQIAWRLGYADPSNFIRAFRKTHGVTPEQHRTSMSLVRHEDKSDVRGAPDT